MYSLHHFHSLRSEKGSFRPCRGLRFAPYDPITFLYRIDMAKTREQKRLYASKRLSKAVDRGIVATSETEKAQAKKWVLAWNLVAKS